MEKVKFIVEALFNISWILAKSFTRFIKYIFFIGYTKQDFKMDWELDKHYITNNIAVISSQFKFITESEDFQTATLQAFIGDNPLPPKRFMGRNYRLPDGSGNSFVLPDMGKAGNNFTIIANTQITGTNYPDAKKVVH